jgi:hypothetical protein
METSGKRGATFRWRGWAVCDALYGAAVVALFVWFVPWRTPACNVVALAYGLAHLLAAPWLWRGSRGAWWWGFGASLAGVALGLLSLAGLLFSWVYLRASFGTFGAGASLVCLLLAVVVANATGLLPALRLAALRRARRRGGAMSPPSHATPPTSSVDPTGVLLLLLVLPSLGLAATAVDITWRFPHRESQAGTSPEKVGALVRAVETAAHARALAALLAASAGVYCGTHQGGTVGVERGDSWHVTTYASGVPTDAVSLPAFVPGLASPGASAGLSEPCGGTPAQVAFARRLRESPFWLLSRVQDRRPLPGAASAWLALGVVPGEDGVEGARSGRGFHAIEAVAAARFGVAPLLPALAEVRLGLDATWARAQLPTDEPWLRVREESWLVGADRALVLPVRGGRAVRPVGLSSEELAEGARRAGLFLARVEREDGRFRYRLDARTARAGDPEDDDVYDLPRHAGTTAALSSWAARRRTAPDGPFLAAAAIRAADWLLAQRTPSGLWASHGGEARLGENALTLIALLAAARVSDEVRPRFEDAARGLATRLVAWVKPDGTTLFRVDPAAPPVGDGATGSALAAAPGGASKVRRPMFEAEEAAYALVLAHGQLGDTRAGAAAARVLDELLHRRDRYFLGWFVYGADAWTCLAVEAGGAGIVPSDGLDHCRGYASFLARMQFDASWPFADREGQFGFSAILVPQTPAAAGFSEALVATWSLARRGGTPDAALTAEARAGLRALLREQVRHETAFLSREPDFVDGAFTRSSVEPEIRIDFVQHALSALMAALDAPDGLREGA